MKEINTKLGKLFIEEWAYDRHCPATREEEERVKIFDSNKRYLTYWCSDTVSELAENDNISEQEWLDKEAEEYKNCDTIEKLLATLDIEYNLVSKDRKEVATYLLDFNIDNDSDLDENEWVNKIGDYYIVINEY